MHFRSRLTIVAFASAIAAGSAFPGTLAGQSVQDFELPPAPTASATPTVQGPVDTESGIVPVRPRAIPTARPTQAPALPPAPPPTVTVRTPPPATPVQPRAVTTAAPSRVAPAGNAAGQVQRPLPAPQGDVVPGASVRADDAVAPSGGLPSASTADPAPPAAVAPVPGGPANDLQTGEDDAGFAVPAAAMVGLGALLLLGLGFMLFRRRSAAASAVPEIERPTVGAAPGARLADLRLSADAVKLTRSMAYATLDYQVTLFNRAKAAASDIVLSADLVTAHGAAPMESQLASPSQSLEQRHVFARISPGQTVRHQGKLQIPLAQARIIRQGSAALIVPLLRVRLDVAGEEPVVRTFVIGQGVPGGGRVAPFRLDDGPRSYAPVAARALD